MSVNLIASRYSSSLLDLANEQNKLERVYSDALAVKESMGVREFYLMLKSPIIKASKKNSILKMLFDGKVDDLMMSFMDLIVRKGRESILPEIIDNFISDYKSLNKISEVKLISAVALDDAVLESIKKELAASSHTDEKIDLDVEVDPSIMGGFVLQIEDKLYDASVSHHINKLRKTFSTTSNN